jgi:uncharacterized protein (DUF885 family)
VDTISALSDRFVDEYATLDPVRASLVMGVARNETRLTDWSPDGIDAVAAFLRRTLDELHRLTPLDDPERQGAGYLEDLAAGELGLIEAGERERSMSAMTGPPSQIRFAFDLMERATPQDWEHIGMRLAAIPAALDGYVASLRHGLAGGRVAPRRLTLELADQCRTWAGTGGAARGGAFSQFAGEYGEGPLRARLAANGELADAAYDRLSEWLIREYAPVALEADGVGDECYRLWARSLLGTADLDLDEAYAWGTEELARLEGEKRAECERVRPGASFAEVVEFLETDPAESIDGVDAFRQWLQQLTDDVIAQLQGVEFDLPEVLRRCEVMTPVGEPGSGPYYTNPAEDLSTPAQVWFPTQGSTRFPRWSQVTTLYHEAVPGHHLEVASTRFTPLTRAQKLGMNSAHAEGWALYAERLMDELGWFTTPATRLGFLTMQAFRAARVVVDIGLHTGRTVPAGLFGAGLFGAGLVGAGLFGAGLPEAGQPWTPELAIPFMAGVGALTPAEAEHEVLRYLSWPSQAPCYKLGERAWLTARDQAKTRAGSAWNRKDWHTKALGRGAMGLDRLVVDLAKL